MSESLEERNVRLHDSMKYRSQLNLGNAPPGRRREGSLAFAEPETLLEDAHNILVYLRQAVRSCASAAGMIEHFGCYLLRQLTPKDFSR